jgi:tRNA threonylcarbamoyladenosine biosynthesis protein TsaE
MKKQQKISWIVPEVASWSTVALDVARTLKPGSILALQGELGAGKTTFVQALAKALGATRMPKSPTFSMLRTYPVKRGAIHRLLHVDAYRIENEHDLIPLDLDAELSEPGTILVLEWPENIKVWLKKRKHETLHIRLKSSGRIASLK